MVGGECSTHAELTCTCSWLNNRMSRKRSEEHTSELQSRLHLVCRLLLEKKKNKSKSSSSIILLSTVLPTRPHSFLQANYGSTRTIWFSLQYTTCPPCVSPTLSSLRLSQS